MHRLFARSTVMFAAAVALGLSSMVGCVIVHEDPPPPLVHIAPPSNAPNIIDVTIDTGGTMSAALGEGVGVFIEYQTGGQWTLWTSSDLAVGGYQREFDILATVIEGQPINDVVGHGLVPGDSLTLTADNQLNLITLTGTGDNGVSFGTSPGAGVELDILVDGVSDSRIVYWVGDGALHQGAPSNPIGFWPSAP